jgi:hypothetical protein
VFRIDFKEDCILIRRNRNLNENRFNQQTDDYGNLYIIKLDKQIT